MYQSKVGTWVMVVMRVAAIGACLFGAYRIWHAAQQQPDGNPIAAVMLLLLAAMQLPLFIMDIKRLRQP